MDMLRIKKFAPMLALLALLAGCKKDTLLPGFDMMYQQDFSLPAGIGGLATHHFYFNNVPTRYQNLLAQYGKTDSDIVQIIPARAAISGIFGDANFAIVDDASIWVYPENNPNARLEAFYRYPTPIDPSNALDLIPSLEQLKPILSGDRFTIDLALRLRSTTTEETPVRLYVQMKANY